MRAFFLPAMVAGFAIAAIPAAAQTPPPQPPAAQATPPPPQAKAVQPTPTREQSAELARAFQGRPRAPCTATTKSAFSVAGTYAGSAGADSIVPYPTIITNAGANWIVATTFSQNHYIAPRDCLYYFAVTYVRDSYYNCGGAVGTRDDIQVYLVKYSPPLYTTPTVISPAGAWAGEANELRATGAYTVLLALNTGDAIVPFVHSDGGPHRCLASYQFTGFRVAP